MQTVAEPITITALPAAPDDFAIVLKLDGFQVTRRDLRLLELAALRHRYLDLGLAHAYFGGSRVNLCRRLVHLVNHGFLAWPQADRPKKVEERAVGLTQRGTRLLEEFSPQLKAQQISRLEWNETKGKARTAHYIDHELGSAYVMTCFERACPLVGITLDWAGHRDPRRHISSAYTDEDGQEHTITIHGDGFFRLLAPAGWPMIPHFLEYETGRKKRSAVDIARKYLTYFRLWECGASRTLRSFRGLFRVLTISPDATYLEHIRKSVRGIGGDEAHPTWPFFMFGLLPEVCDLTDPTTMFAARFSLADDDAPPMSLLRGLVPTPAAAAPA